MDCGYTEPCRYEVKIMDGNKADLGSGALFVPRRDKFVYIFTAAHLFWYTEDTGHTHTPADMELFLGYAQKRSQTTKISAHIRRAYAGEVPEEINLILVHKKYDPGDRASKWDAAILRIQREEWMEAEMKAFRFPASYENRALKGWGYPGTMTLAEMLESGVVDFFRASLPLEGEAKKFDSENMEIEFKYSEQRQFINLKGYSGTGLYAEPDLFYGVLCKSAGSDEAGPHAWVTAWEAFFGILDAYGDVGYQQYRKSVRHEEIDLNQQVWWLPESVSYRGGLMEDDYSINLQSLLTGMTDAYTVILASIWRGGIGRNLENKVYRYLSNHTCDDPQRVRQQWFEYDEYFPDYGISLDFGDGIVINLQAYHENAYESRQRVSEILRQREEKAAECKLIINIWSHNPTEAFQVLRGIWEELSGAGAEFLSAISYSMMAGRWNAEVKEQTTQTKERLKRLNPPDRTKEAVLCRDMETAVWWELLEDLSGSDSQEDVLLGYQAAKQYHPAMQRWIGGLKSGWRKAWKEHPEELTERLEGKDIGLLCWEIYLYQKKLPDTKAPMWKELLNEIKKYDLSSTEAMLDILGREEDLEIDAELRPEDVARWARTAEKKNLKKYFRF